MAVMVIHNGPTLTQEKYDEACRLLLNGAKDRLDSLSDWPTDGIVSHAAGQADDGFYVVDIWESEEAFGRFGERLGAIMQELGVEEQPRVFPAHNSVTS